MFADRRLWAITAAFLSAHLALAAAMPLVDDEAYYTIWAMRPQWGYYDHPPMIAWMISLGQTLIGENRLGVRLIPVLAFAAVTPMVWRLVWLSGGSAVAAARAALFYNAGTLVAFVGTGATPDAGSVLFWTGAIWVAAEAHARPRLWLLAGLFAGLGVLSKYTNLFLGVGLIAWAVGTAPGRRMLAAPWIWAGGLVALVIMAPNLLWSAGGDGLGFQRQFGRLGWHGVRWDTAVSYPVLVVLMASPIVAVAAVRAWRAGGRPVPQMLWVSSAPLLGYLWFHAGSAEVHGNWLITAMPPVAVLAGLGAERWRRGWVAAAAGLGLLPVILAWVVGFWPGPAVLPPSAPPNQAKGWRAVSAEIAARAEAAGADWIATTEYPVRGQLGWYGVARPVHEVREPFRYRFLPPMASGLCDRPALLVSSSVKKKAWLDTFFREYGAPATVTRTWAGFPVQTLTVIPVRGLRACPP